MIADDFGAIREALGMTQATRASSELSEATGWGLDMVGIRHGIVRLDGEDDAAFQARIAARA